MLETIIVVATPIVVSGIGWVVKWVMANKTVLLNNGYRKTILRAVVAVASFIVVLGGAVLTGVEVDAVSIDTFAQSIVAFFGATGIYFLAKAKKSAPTPVQP